MGAVKSRSLLIFFALVTACSDGQTPQKAQRISLDEARARPAEPLASPDTSAARWRATENGQAIVFAQVGGVPLLTLECDVRGQPAQLTLVRHVAARPGQGALFPVLGNGTVSRFLVDATLHEGEWRWEGNLPASDPMFDVFTGPLELQATLPGGGTLLIEGSRIPGEFVNWCRAGGRLQRAEEAEASEASSAPPAP